LSDDDDVPLSDLADELGVGDDAAEADDGTEPSDNGDGGTAGDDSQSAGDGDDPRADAPLSELAAEVAADADAVDPEESPFEAVDTGEIDPAEAWERLESDEGFEQPEPDAGVEAVDEPATDAPEHVVDKRQYCQQCPYLSSPPEISCGHEGTEILEVRDGDSFRVRNCPMIGEDGPNFDAAGDS
jgi:hypothetical protein